MRVDDDDDNISDDKSPFSTKSGMIKQHRKMMQKHSNENDIRNIDSLEQGSKNKMDSDNIKSNGSMDSPNLLFSPERYNDNMEIIVEKENKDIDKSDKESYINTQVCEDQSISSDESVRQTDTVVKIDDYDNKENNNKIVIVEKEMDYNENDYDNLPIPIEKSETPDIKVEQVVEIKETSVVEDESKEY